MTVLERCDAPTFDWVERAACRPSSVDTLLFVTELPPCGSARHGSLGLARAVCERCPVQDECFQDGIDAGDWFTVRAGMTGAMRRKVSPLPPRRFMCGFCARWFRANGVPVSYCSDACRLAAKHEQHATYELHRKVS